MKLAFIRTFVVAACLTVVGTGSAFADQIFVTIQGVRTAFPKITATGFGMETFSPRDPATGQATGKRQHKAFSFTKEWGHASALLFQALSTDEVLRSVVIEIHKTNPNGMEVPFERIVLTNAVVTDLRRHTPVIGKPPVEEISLVYQKSEIEYLTDKTLEIDE